MNLSTPGMPWIEVKVHLFPEDSSIHFPKEVDAVTHDQIVKGVWTALLLYGNARPIYRKRLTTTFKFKGRARRKHFYNANENKQIKRSRKLIIQLHIYVLMLFFLRVHLGEDKIWLYIDRYIGTRHFHCHIKKIQKYVRYILMYKTLYIIYWNIIII